MPLQSLRRAKGRYLHVAASIKNKEGPKAGPVTQRLLAGKGGDDLPSHLTSGITQRYFFTVVERAVSIWPDGETVTTA